MVRKGGSCLNYYELLNKMIEESKLTHKEIAEKCMEYGVRINPSYISKLKTGKQPPASDDVNIAIAKACGFDNFDDFLFEAFLEKAPVYIRDFITNLVKSFRAIIKSTYRTQFPKELLPILEEELNKYSDNAIIKMALPILQSIQNQLDHNINSADYTPTIRSLRIEDESMSPRIPKGSIIHLEEPTNINNGDFVVIKLGENLYTRRYVEVKDSIVLLSENYKFDPIVIEKADKSLIIGKVVKITIDIE